MIRVKQADCWCARTGRRDIPEPREVEWFLSSTELEPARHWLVMTAPGSCQVFEADELASPGLRIACDKNIREALTFAGLHLVA